MKDKLEKSTWQRKKRTKDNNNYLGVDLKTKLIRVNKEDYEYIMDLKREIEARTGADYPTWYIVEKLVEQGFKRLERQWANSLSI